MVTLSKFNSGNSPSSDIKGAEEPAFDVETPLDPFMLVDTEEPLGCDVLGLLANKAIEVVTMPVPPKSNKSKVGFLLLKIKFWNFSFNGFCHCVSS